MTKMDRDVSAAEVNEELIAKGFDPGAIRTFAWELVAQDLREPLPSHMGHPAHQGPRSQALKTRLWRLVDPLMDSGATPDGIRRALGELADEIAKRNE